MQQDIDQLKQELSDLKAQFANHVHSGDDSQFIGKVPDGFSNIPLAAITPITGGTVIDVQARGAASTLITYLHSLGFTS